MMAAKVPLDRLNQQKQTIQWQCDDYRSLNASLKDFDTTIFNVVSMQSTYNQKIVTSSDDSKVSAKAISTSANLSAQIGVSQLAKSASWKSAGVADNFTAGTDQVLQFTVTDPGSVKTRDVTISISAQDTVDDIMKKFNSSSLGASMFELAGHSIVMSNNKTGTGASITGVDADTKSFMASLGFDVSGGSVVADNLGQDAVITFNGYEMTQKSNTFNISGVSYTIKGVTTSDVNISTATDVDAIYNSIKGFVDKYNDMIKMVNDKLSEKRNRDYPPLTDDQRKSMTEAQITSWEIQAKSGLLRNDSYLSSGLNRMRQDMYSPVTGVNVGGYTQLSQIGIKTSSDYSENGKLVIDENTLRQMIQDDPQGIYKLFNGGGDTYESKGIGQRLRDSLASTMSQVTDKAGKASYNDTQYILGKQLTSLGKQITDFQSKLTDLESRYFKQFSAMEQAMQRANQQSAYLSQQFSG